MEQIQIHQYSPDEFKSLLVTALKEYLGYSPKEPADELLTRKEVASRLKMSLATLHKYSDLGILRSRKIGGRVYYLWSEIIQAAKIVEPSNPPSSIIK